MIITQFFLDNKQTNKPQITKHKCKQGLTVRRNEEIDEGGKN